MAQIIKHRRGSISNVGTLSPINPGEIILGTGSIGYLEGSILFVGDSSSYKAVPQLYYGEVAPNVTGYSHLEGISFYETSSNNIFILKQNGNVRLNLAGSVSGSTITPDTVITTLLTASYVDMNYVTVNNNLTVGVSGSLVVQGRISSSLIPTYSDSFDLGASGSNWNNIWATNGQFTTASGYFTGSFAGDGSQLTGLATNLLVYGDGNISQSVNLLTQNLKVLGTTNEIETSLALNSGSDGYTIQIGLPDDVTIGGDLTVSGGDIKSSTGAAVITLSGSNAEFANDVTITGNLTVNGTSTIVNSTTVEIGDNIIALNGTGAANAGLIVQDPTSPYTVSGSLLWDSTNDYWIAGPLNSEQRLAVQGTGSLTTNALVYGGASGEILSIDAPVTTGSLAQWDGSAWIMSNIIDGGTF